MPATQAQALSPELVIREADPDADARALERLAVWALRYSPVVAADPPDGLVIDATGADHLHGGEEAMLADMVGRARCGRGEGAGRDRQTPGARPTRLRAFSPTSRSIVPAGESRRACSQRCRLRPAA